MHIPIASEKLDALSMEFQSKKHTLFNKAGSTN